MGNITVLDIIGAAVIAGFLLIMVYHSNARMNETLFTSGSDLVVQEHLVNLVNTIEKDFRRIGYCRNQLSLPDPSKIIVSAGKSSFGFLTDIDDDGVVDTLRYYTGAAGSATATPNPRDRLLYRTVNGGKPIEMNIGLTAFDVRYFDVNGDSIAAPVADPSGIHSMDLSITLENTHPYDNEYTFASWRQLRLRTRNLASR
jgi:hypothetical protein